MKQTLMHRITLALLYLCLAGEAAFLFSLPGLLPGLWAWDPIPPEGVRYLCYLGCWFLIVIGALVITYTLTRMIRSIPGGPFKKENVSCLRRMGIVALVMILFTAGTCLFYYRTLMLLVSMVELLCGLFSLILSGIFQKAVEYSEENALTI